MRRFLVISLIAFLAVAIAVPAMALEVKYGGLFRARVISQSYFADPPANFAYPPLTANVTPHYNRLDQRLRMFFDFVSSENLKVVTKLEANTIWGAWGQSGTNGRSNISGGGNVGADVNNLGVKNAYVDFRIPAMKQVNFKVGVQGINLLDSWIVDDDFSAALMEADLKPFKVILGYVSGQNFNYRTEDENVDDVALAVTYAEGPFKAALIGFYQDAHNTPISVFPGLDASLPWTPVHANVTTTPFANPFYSPFYPYPTLVVERNQLFDLGLNLGYKLDYLNAYVNFVKNFGSAKIGPSALKLETYDYTGWMVDAGFNYFCAPWTFNLGGFYTSGKPYNQAPDNKQITISGDLDWFTYPVGTSKYFSEIIGGGILDNYAPNVLGGYWRGYPYPTNLWTVTVGGGWQVLPDTKLSLSYWYFGTAESVPGTYDAHGNVSMSSDIGHEVDLYVTQRLVDKLNLDLVGAILFEGDAYRPQLNNPIGGETKTVYELGARLQWAF